MNAKKRANSKRGKKARAAGARFELKVRTDLKAQGWIVTKWMNNIDFENDKLIPAKRKYNPFLRALSIGTGFPDFIAFKKRGKKSFEIIGIEVKRNGWLDKEEKAKCKWLLEKEIFLKILIAKGKKQGRSLNVEYVDFEGE
ncbi:hypothetical protein CMI44_01690 [Candidatus Pacearchaeota archaeon]|nr:hypothetical protein [Candidatus Pacearchaeota archaeon]|tara:strand:+ start:1379 stop:1801 length:423 start_codon:yes stop_codon:yes gene_type:complete